MHVAVLIPTFRRNDSLERALRSVLAQTRLPDEIVIADNSPEAGARDLITSLSPESPVTLIYVHVPDPGVANARNAGFNATQAPVIVQLDDDESAPPHWLHALLQARQALDAPVVFGPVVADMPLAAPVRAAYGHRLFSRQGPAQMQVLNHYYGCGNALIDRSAMPLPDPVYAPETNDMGGEDDLLFDHLQRQGVVFGWAPDAQVTEHVLPDRQVWRHLLQRSFAYGQGPSQLCWTDGRANWPRLIGWMGVGLVQMLGYGLAAPVARLHSAKAAAACVDRAAQGVGKLVWSNALAPRFYGASTD